MERNSLPAKRDNFTTFTTFTTFSKHINKQFKNRQCKNTGGSRFHASSNLDIALATVSSSSFAYTCRVIFVDEWPRTLLTTSISAPLFSRSVAPV